MGIRTRDATGQMSLRCRTGRSATQTAATDQLQLLDLSSHGWHLGLLRPQKGEDYCAQSCGGALRVGRQASLDLPLRQLRLRDALATR